jgi:hypothetical protein
MASVFCFIMPFVCSIAGQISLLSSKCVDVFDVSLGWIDKIPLASFINKEKDIHGNLIKEKVEIGDFLLVYTHSQTLIKAEYQILERFIVIQLGCFYTFLIKGNFLYWL